MAAASARTQSRLRRLFRQRSRRVAEIGVQAEQQLERNFMRRFGRLQPVRRFVIGWLLLVVLLIGCVLEQSRTLSGYFQSLQPVPGGIYSEGVVDSYTNASPLYATGPANSAISKLLFASLFKYNQRNKLVGDLAERWQVDVSGKQYTVRLRDGLTWQDGKPLTADDVVFTYHMIQNPDVQSPLNVSWQDVKVSATDKRTILFELPNPLSSFPDSMTNGIVPEHALKDIKPANMRSTQFNTIRPIGAGPFELRSIEVHGNSSATRQEQITMVPFAQYHAGAPKLASFIIRTFPNEQAMLDSFRKKTTTAMVRPQRLPEDIAQDDAVHQINSPLTAANMVFFKTSTGPLQDVTVRRALVAAADVSEIGKDVPKPLLPVRSPLLQGSPGYNPQYQQRFEGAQKAAAILDKSNEWPLDDKGMRYSAKTRAPLSFRLYAQDTPENVMITDRLRQQWRKIGVDMQITLQSNADLPNTIATHSYDALLYGISLGTDPDEYVYWHSRQADVRSQSRLNFSEYQSVVADTALDAGRTRTDLVLRAIKYQPFLQAWQNDAPALGLYQPYFTYVTRGQVSGLEERTLTQPTDRFNNVQEWMIRRVPQQIQ